MNPQQDSGDNSIHTDHSVTTSLFLAHNAIKYDNFLRRFPFATRKHIKALPLFFHVNQNLMPGFVNNQVPNTIYNYIPDAETINHARTFNGSFSFDVEAEVPESSIDAIYLQDNLKSGKLILWIIHNNSLEPEMVSLLREKAHYLNKWRESRNINLHCYVSLPCDMPATYWGNKYSSLHMDKSLFLDNFYSEGILIAGKLSVWWLLPPKDEKSYEQLIARLQTNHKEEFNSLVDIGSIANARPQDYLSSAILNIINIKHCPEETWLNILDLCHKLTAYPVLDCASLHIKVNIYAGQTENDHYQDIYCKVINDTIDMIYGRENVIVIARTLKLIAHRHDGNAKNINIYRMLLAYRRDSDPDFINCDRLAYEYTTATEIIFDLIKQAFLWLIKKINSIDDSIIPVSGGLKALTDNLLAFIDIKQNHIPVTNINPINNIKPYDVCIKHIIENRNNNWSLVVVDHDNQSFEIRQGKNPVELAAWGVLNRLITHETRISVSCPYLSIKQTQIADITNILLKHLQDIPGRDISLETFTANESPVYDLYILNELKSTTEKPSSSLEIYRFQFTDYGEAAYDKKLNLYGILSFLCDGLSSDLIANRKQHPISMYSISSGASSAFINEIRLIYNKLCQFVFGPKKGYTHFIDTISGHYYAIERHDKQLTAHTNINTQNPEEHFASTSNVLMLFSGDIENTAILNYLYRQNIYGYLQLFYKTDGNTSYIYILDENGHLTRFSQPFYDQQSFINQWLMFLYNSRHRIRTISDKTADVPNIEIFELTYNQYGQLLKSRLTAAGLPSDKRYFDLKIIIHGEKGQQSIIFECEDMQFSSADHGTDIYAALRRYLEKNFKAGSKNPVYLTDVDMPLSQIMDAGQTSLQIRDFIKYKINIEKRLNTIINRT